MGFAGMSDIWGDGGRWVTAVDDISHDGTLNVINTKLEHSKKNQRPSISGLRHCAVYTEDCF